jgi:hypothetical protein
MTHRWVNSAVRLYFHAVRPVHPPSKFVPVTLDLIVLNAPQLLITATAICSRVEDGVVYANVYEHLVMQWFAFANGPHVRHPGLEERIFSVPGRLINHKIAPEKESSSRKREHGWSIRDVSSVPHESN